MLRLNEFLIALFTIEFTSCQGNIFLFCSLFVCFFMFAIWGVSINLRGPTPPEFAFLFFLFFAFANPCEFSYGVVKLTLVYSLPTSLRRVFLLRSEIMQMAMGKCQDGGRGVEIVLNTFHIQ